MLVICNHEFACCLHTWFIQIHVSVLVCLNTVTITISALKFLFHFCLKAEELLKSCSNHLPSECYKLHVSLQSFVRSIRSATVRGCTVQYYSTVSTVAVVVAKQTVI